MRQPTLKVWHGSGDTTFYYFASTLSAAAEVLQALAEYDETIGREAGEQGLEVLGDNGWTEWRDESGRAIHEVIEAGDHVGR
jgi:hypothetical protein